jgi:hypothetical protein
MLLYMCPHKKPRSADANLHTLRMPHARLPRTLRMRHLGRPTQTCGSPRNTTSYICILILLYMCPHTPICVLIPYCFTCVFILYICVLILLYVSSYCYICVLIFLYVCSYCYICVLILLYVSSYCYICARILLYMCPHTALYVSPYYFMCVFILLYMCPRTAMYVSS